MARKRLEHFLDEFRASVNQRIDKLSSQVKIYGAVVTLGAVAIPAYSQIRVAYADTAIEAAVTRQIDKAVTKAADTAAAKVLERMEKTYCE